MSKKRPSNERFVKIYNDIKERYPLETTIHFDPKEILEMLDENDEVPGIYMLTGNRSAGKTYAIKWFMIGAFLVYGFKFAIFVRKQHQMYGKGEEYYKDIINFPGYTLKTQTRNKTYGVLELYKEGEAEPQECGYVIPLHMASDLRGVSAQFTDVTWCHFDEYQAESLTGYLPKETFLFASVMSSIHRDHAGVRDVPVFMTSNTFSRFNPYFTEMGVSQRLRTGMKKLHGSGWVLLQTKNEVIASMVKETSFYKAFKNSKYFEYANENNYLDDDSLIERCTDRYTYLFTVINGGRKVGVIESKGVIYFTKRAEAEFKTCLVSTATDMAKDRMLLQASKPTMFMLRVAYQEGRMRFEDIPTQLIAYDFLGIRS